MSAPQGTSTRLRASDGREFDAYICGESGKGRPGVVVFSPVFGIDADMIAMADDWAASGFLVAVHDYYFRVRPGPLGRNEEGRKLAMERWKKLDVDGAVEDTRAVVDRLLASSACNGKWGAIGYCAGGELAFLAAARLGAMAAAGFHATHIHEHLAEAQGMRAAMTLHYGADDPLVPVSEVAAIKAALLPNPRVDVHLYDGAKHGFSFRSTSSYHEIAASRSQRRAKQLLETLK